MNEQIPLQSRRWMVNEQTIYDRGSGIIIQFRVDEDGLPRLRMFGKLPMGNREFGFGKDGNHAFSGTVTGDVSGFPELPAD